MEVPHHTELPGCLPKEPEPHLIHYGDEEEGGNKEGERWELMKKRVFYLCFIHDFVYNFYT